MQVSKEQRKTLGYAQSMFEYLVPRKVGGAGGVIGQNQPPNPNGFGLRQLSVGALFKIGKNQNEPQYQNNGRS